ncbi:hypothetical protein [Zhihengliuella sp. ISTPL4]|uniref:hypothetical protein n=1 Tax=Zhihengliuella sp. ISTPL4 TaxID=2058657 RepID=UPI000C7ABFA2|nr:hypothetical protein [Zhihengliuella sp. ISTPL4]
MANTLHTDNLITRNYIEAAGVGALENFLSRAEITVARPNRQDTPVDAVAINEDLIAVPIQLKVVLQGGMTVHRKYLGRNLKLVYVNLGLELGGLHEHTSFVVLDPETAWQLPTKLGLKFDPEYHDTYRWPTTTANLRAALEEHTCRTPAELADALF